MAWIYCNILIYSEPIFFIPGIGIFLSFIIWDNESSNFSSINKRVFISGEWLYIINLPSILGIPPFTYDLSFNNVLTYLTNTLLFIARKTDSSL